MPDSLSPATASRYFSAHLARVDGVTCYSILSAAPSPHGDADCPALDVTARVHWARGNRRCERRAKSAAVETMTVWIEPNGRIYGEW